MIEVLGQSGKVLQPRGSVGVVIHSPSDLDHPYRVRFADSKRGWLAGNQGVMAFTTDGGTTWTPMTLSTDEVAASALAFSPNGRFGIAPLWQGEALVMQDGSSWRRVTVAKDFGYSMPSAQVFDDGTAIVLSADGRLARYAIASQSP